MHFAQVLNSEREREKKMERGCKLKKKCKYVVKNVKNYPSIPSKWMSLGVNIKGIQMPREENNQRSPNQAYLALKLSYQ